MSDGARLQRAVDHVLGLVLPTPRPRAVRERIGLSPVTRLLSRVGDPHRGLPCLHVAGSKGKGSVVLATETLLQGAGLRTAAFTSPHLARWTERFRIDGREVAPGTFCDVVEALMPHVEAERRARPAEPPGFFDLLTTVAFVLFRDAAVDCAILETGLGGRVDATNVCEPAACAITSIEMEHADKLGPSLGEIAAHKAGIIKDAVPVVVGPLPPEAMRVVTEQAARTGAPVVHAGTAAPARRWDPGPDAPPVQRVNAAVALALARSCRLADADRLERAAAAPPAAPPGRMEIVSREPLIVVDAAHTRESAEALAAWLAGLAPAWELLVSLSRGHAWERALGPVLPLARSITVTRADPVRSRRPESLAREIGAGSPGARVEVVDDPRAALARLRSRLGPGGALCATGSVYLAGAVRSAVLDEAPVNGPAG